MPLTIRLSARILPWDTTGKSQATAHAPQQAEVKLLIPCADTDTIGDLWSKITKTYEQVFPDAGGLRIRCLQTEEGDILHSLFLVSDCFDRREASASSAQWTVVVRRERPNVEELRLLGNARLFSIAPASWARPQKRSFDDYTELPATIPSVEDEVNVEESRVSQKRARTDFRSVRRSQTLDQVIHPAERDVEIPARKSPSVVPPEQPVLVVDSQESSRSNQPGSYATPQSIAHAANDGLVSPLHSQEQNNDGVAKAAAILEKQPKAEPLEQELPAQDLADFDPIALRQSSEDEDVEEILETDNLSNPKLPTPRKTRSGLRLNGSGSDPALNRQQLPRVAANSNAPKGRLRRPTAPSVKKTNKPNGNGRKTNSSKDIFEVASDIESVQGLTSKKRSSTAGRSDSSKKAGGASKYLFSSAKPLQKVAVEIPRTENPLSHRSYSTESRSSVLGNPKSQKNKATSYTDLTDEEDFAMDVDKPSIDKKETPSTDNMVRPDQPRASPGHVDEEANIGTDQVPLTSANLSGKEKQEANGTSAGNHHIQQKPGRESDLGGADESRETNDDVTSEATTEKVVENTRIPNTRTRDLSRKANSSVPPRNASENREYSTSVARTGPRPVARSKSLAVSNSHARLSTPQLSIAKKQQEQSNQTPSANSKTDHSPARAEKLKQSILDEQNQVKDLTKGLTTTPRRVASITPYIPGSSKSRDKSGSRSDSRSSRSTSSNNRALQLRATPSPQAKDSILPANSTTDKPTTAMAPPEKKVLQRGSVARETPQPSAAANGRLKAAKVRKAATEDNQTQAHRSFIQSLLKDLPSNKAKAKAKLEKLDHEQSVQKPNGIDKASSKDQPPAPVVTSRNEGKERVVNNKSAAERNQKLSAQPIVRGKTNLEEAPAKEDNSPQAEEPAVDITKNNDQVQDSLSLPEPRKWPAVNTNQVNQWDESSKKSYSRSPAREVHSSSEESSEGDSDSEPEPDPRVRPSNVVDGENKPAEDSESEDESGSRSGSESESGESSDEEDEVDEIRGKPATMLDDKPSTSKTIPDTELTNKVDDIIEKKAVQVNPKPASSENVKTTNIKDAKESSSEEDSEATGSASDTEDTGSIVSERSIEEDEPELPKLKTVEKRHASVIEADAADRQLQQESSASLRNERPPQNLPSKSTVQSLQSNTSRPIVQPTYSASSKYPKLSEYKSNSSANNPTGALKTSSQSTQNRAKHHPMADVYGSDDESDFDEDDEDDSDEEVINNTSIATKPGGGTGNRLRKGIHSLVKMSHKNLG